MPTTLIAPPTIQKSISRPTAKTSNSFTNSPTQTKPTTPTVLRTALPSFKTKENKTKTGLFRFSSQGVVGKQNEQDKSVILDRIKTLREGSEAIGIELEMDAVGYVAIHTQDSTLAYRFDSESDPRSPHLVGAMLNERVPMGCLLRDLVNSTH